MRCACVRRLQGAQYHAHRIMFSVFTQRHTEGMGCPVVVNAGVDLGAHHRLPGPRLRLLQLPFIAEAEKGRIFRAMLPALSLQKPKKMPTRLNRSALRKSGLFIACQLTERRLVKGPQFTGVQTIAFGTEQINGANADLQVL